MKFCLKSFAFFLAVLPACVCAQHHSSVTATVDGREIRVRQVLVFRNDSQDTLRSIVLNDWNNAYSGKDTPLSRRFSDEFHRSFYRAKNEQRGSTSVGSIAIGTSSEENPAVLPWLRTQEHPDLLEVFTPPIFPGQELKLVLVYDLTLPDDRFTGYGYNVKGDLHLKDCFLTPARFENHRFARYSNENLDDSANGVTNWEIALFIPKGKRLVSDLDVAPADLEAEGFDGHILSGKNRVKYDIFIETEQNFLSFRNEFTDVANNLESKKTDDIRKAIIVDNVVRFVDGKIGRSEFSKIAVSQADYAQNPFYGLNQLPSFINVFSDDFIYELKFLKTYTDKFLKQNLKLDPRKDHWIYDAVQVSLMMDYIDEYYPDMKMTGTLSRMKLLQSYNLMRQPFNGQYSYFYMLMARKNLDQAAGTPKDSLLKFNEQIATKYRAGLGIKYLDSYLGNDIVGKSIREFFDLNRTRQTTLEDFKNILTRNAAKDIGWFFKTVIGSRDLIDYKIDKASATKDSISFTLKNRTGVSVPMPIYGVKDGKIVSKQWLEDIKTDSIYTMPRNDAEKLVINYENHVPEYNIRNNWRALKGFQLNRPVKFVFFKDLEDPHYNQLLYVPTMTYNLYDGLVPGIRFYNKTVLDKVFAYDINPMYSTRTQSLAGATALVFNQYIRESRLYHVKYYLTGSYFHYAPDATYVKITPSVQFRIREEDFRDNRKQFVTLREVIVDRQPTDYIVTGNTENYAVFNARYSNTKTEIAGHFGFTTDFQASADFGKSSVEFGYRKMFRNNRQLDLRLYAGTFLYNKTSNDYFSFALDRPTDYLFDNNYYGRSETSGLFSQQLILTEGGFKSKLEVPYANQWISTLNAGINVWNWIEVYADAGFVKNHHADAKFLYDSGVRLNLVTDYFELYFPVYSSNGWEFQPDYGERIRFIVTLDPKILVNLFTRKWF